MIRLIDAIVLAHTKLKVHRIRTGIVISVAGLMFGVVGALVMISQGVFSSIDNFRNEGLNNRSIIAIYHWDPYAFDPQSNLENQDFIQRLEVAHSQLVAKKTVAAKKYNVEYNAKVEDPSPIAVDKNTGKKSVLENSLNVSLVQNVVKEISAEKNAKFDINSQIKKYDSAHVIQQIHPVLPQDGSLTYMKNGTERSNNQSPEDNEAPPSLQILESSITKPFLANGHNKVEDGYIPVIVPYARAEKILGLKALDKNASSETKLQRLKEVRSRINEVKIMFCYRNSASLALYEEAVQQQTLKQATPANEYIEPNIVYGLPSNTSCGAVEVIKDKRSLNEKKATENYTTYQKEIGEYPGDPYQKLIKVQGVGLSGSPSSISETWSMSGVVDAIFSSWLGHGNELTIPDDQFMALPESERPVEVFSQPSSDSGSNDNWYSTGYLVEFGNKDQARSALRTMGYSEGSNVIAGPFGSGVLIADEAQDFMSKAMIYIFLVIGGIGAVILASIIGRTVSEGRRESAIFRAIGAKRLDIGAIYGIYVVFLALRIILFAFILALTVALIVDYFMWEDATVGAQLAFAASDTSKTFRLFSLNSPYLLWIGVVIFVSSILASVVPILLGARRNPIKDMRNDS